MGMSRFLFSVRRSAAVPAGQLAYTFAEHRILSEILIKPAMPVNHDYHRQ